MNLNTLNDFRHGMYHCFGNAKDALFNLVNALASKAGASSFPELSLSPFFERTWASLYEALEDGQIDAVRLREIFVDFAPLPGPGAFVVLARPWVEGCYRPWGTRRSVLTLTQVRRVMPTFLHELGTPARPPQQRGKAPGRAKGFHPRPRTQHPVIRKTSKKQKTSKKTTSA